MKIRITTDREIRDSDYDIYIKTLQKQGVPVNGRNLLSQGEFSYTNRNKYTTTTTTYKIVN